MMRHTLFTSIFLHSDSGGGGQLHLTLVDIGNIIESGMPFQDRGSSQ